MTRSVSFIEPSPLHPLLKKRRTDTVLLKALLNYFCFKCCQTDMVKSCHFMGSTLTSFEELAWKSIDIFLSGIRHCKTNQLLFLSRFLQQINGTIPVGEGNLFAGQREKHTSEETGYSVILSVLGEICSSNLTSTHQFHNQYEEIEAGGDSNRRKAGRVEREAPDTDV